MGFSKNVLKKRIATTLKRFLDDESGQSTTEYILILAAVVMIANMFRTTITQKLKDIIGKVSGKMDESINDIQ